MDALLDALEEVRHISGDIVEIGSYNCGATIAMAASTDKMVYAFDLFGGLPPYHNTNFQNFANADWDEIIAACSPFQNITLVRGLHEMTVPAFVKAKQDPIALLFMDSDHYSSHLVSLINLWPLVSVGGLAVFHDWSFEDVQLAITQTIKKELPYSWSWRATAGMGIIRKVA